MPVLTANPPSHPFRCVLHGIDPTSEAVNPNKNPTPGEFQQIYNLYWNDPVKGEFSSASAHDYFIGVLSAYGQMEDTIRSNAELNWERVQASLPDRYGHRPALASIHRAQSLYSTWVQPLVVAWIDEVEVQKRLWAKETHDLDASFSDLYTPENSRYKWRDITKIDISNIQQLLLFLHDRQRQELELELRRSTNLTAQDFVTQIVTTPMLRKCARNLPPNAAQCLMLMVQQTLDSQGKSAQTKIDHTLVKLLQDIAYTTRSFPYFARVNVFNVSRGPVRGGTEGALFVARLDGTEVMVKVHRDHYAGILSKPLMYELFQRESRNLLIWYQLSRRKLENIVPLEGVSIIEKDDHDIVTRAVMSRWVSAEEWMKSFHDQVGHSTMYRKRGFKQLVKGIAFGLLILHRNYIIHGDLHLANVLLKVNANHDILRVMLCDFGMTRISRLLLQEPNSTSVQPWVSFKPGYAPPENRTAEQSPEAPGDVFSFAIAMWHWVQERPPTSHEAPNGTLPEKMPNAWKEIVMEDEDEDGMYSLARWMTDADPKKRPTIEVVMRELRRLGYV